MTPGELGELFKAIGGALHRRAEGVQNDADEWEVEAREQEDRANMDRWNAYADKLHLQSVGLDFLSRVADGIGHALAPDPEEQP